VSRGDGSVVGVTSKVVIACGSGALGTRLVTSLAGKCGLVVLTRSPNPNANVRQIYWDCETVGRGASELGAPDTALINLAGKLVDCRPTRSNIRELTHSRSHLPGPSFKRVNSCRCRSRTGCRPAPPQSGRTPVQHCAPKPRRFPRAPALPL
jgi:hypothetical protein